MPRRSAAPWVSSWPGVPAEIVDLASGRPVPLASFLVQQPAEGSTTTGLEDLLRADGVEVASASTIAAMPAATPELRPPGVVIASPARGRTPAPAAGNAASRRSRSSQQSPLRGGQRGHLDERRPASRMPWLALLLGGSGVLLVVVFVLLIGKPPKRGGAPTTAGEDARPEQPARSSAPVEATVPSAPVPAPMTSGSRVSTSWVWQNDSPGACDDGLLPSTSADERIPRMTWWNHLGTAEWVEYDFPRPLEVGSVDVYWFADDKGCAVPASWQVLYRDGEAWKPVQGAGIAGCERDRFNHQTFATVTTTALRLAVALQPERSAGVLEWRVGGRAAQPPTQLALRSRSSASWNWRTDPMAALNDGILPASSNDTHVPRMTWYGHRGGAEWVQYDFPEAAVVDSIDVYWFEDREGCYLPATWQVLYRDGDAWKPVQGVPPAAAIDHLQHYAFTPVATTALRLAVEMQPDHAAGVLEWQVWGHAEK